MNELDNYLKTLRENPVEVPPGMASRMAKIAMDAPTDRVELWFSWLIGEWWRPLATAALPLALGLLLGGYLEASLPVPEMDSLLYAEAYEIVEVWEDADEI